MTGAVVLIALLFSPLAAAMAFSITYAEYAKHLVDRKQVLRRALKTALVTFLFFLVVPPLLIWLFLAR
ncbi:MAG: hypothetical protein M0C28_24305 [Candidatus Moduliflexus flocculans]|nr:hypothetical protein [Candidatus Moduliflexus flocculans]